MWTQVPKVIGSNVIHLSRGLEVLLFRENIEIDNLQKHDGRTQSTHNKQKRKQN